jgi:outer membrane immunogenic protein
MKKLVLALSAVAAFSVPALAADMAAKAPYHPAPVAYAPSWTGCYIGGGGGYGLFNQENADFNDGPPRTQVTAPVTSGGRGWFGTVQGGCDYQFGLGAQQLVIGAFADYDFSDLHADVAPGGISVLAPEKMSSAWAVGGRIGWVALPGLMTFFSAGYTEATFDRLNFSGITLPVQAPATFADKQTYRGWFLGAGDEYALSFLPGLFWKTEYRLSRFDTERLTIRDSATGLPITPLESLDSKKWVQTVRSELVYRFNWGGAPIAARY